MGERLQEALDAGAIGMSTGLVLRAGLARRRPAEIEALAARLRPAGAIYTTHMRDEAEHVLDSLDESFAVGRAAGVPVVISHHKTTGVANFGRTARNAAEDRRPRWPGRRSASTPIPISPPRPCLRRERIEDALKVLITWSKAAPEQAGRELDDDRPRLGRRHRRPRSRGCSRPARSIS